MEGALTPEPRLRRTALVEIPLRLDRLRVTTPLQTVTNGRERSPALPASYLSPANSPDEMVIQQRGRRNLPVTWSPDIDLKRSSPFTSLVRTPPKNNNRLSPQKLGVTLRSTPRKRLILGDVERVPLTPEKIDFSDISTPQKLKMSTSVMDSPPVKRARIEKKSPEHKGPIDTALKGLSPTQLVNIIKGLINKHPAIEKEIRDDLPMPDLAPLEERLSYLKSNIFKSLPTSRLTSKTDSPAYSRVFTHLSAFKKCLIDQGKVLVESQHWSSVMQYVFVAWNYVKSTPVWDNQPHNVLRKQCFKSLVNFCMTALKKGDFDTEYLMDAQDKVAGLIADSDDVQTCLKFIQTKLRDGY